MTETMSNITLFDLYSPRESEDDNFLSDIDSSTQKKINSKYFYDEIGSKLFDKITDTKDYYPTKKEIEILDSNYDFSKNLPDNSGCNRIWQRFKQKNNEITEYY